MSLIRKYYSNFSHPQGLLGKYAVYRMNGKRHAALFEWALDGVAIDPKAYIADLGCGGGANVARMLTKCPQGRVTGIDISPVAVGVARKVNKKAIEDKRCTIAGGHVKQLPLIKETQDMVTAFETVYYWPAFDVCMNEIFRVLKPGGTVLIANETDGIDPEGFKWAKLIGPMNIFTIDQLKLFPEQAGFVNIQSKHDTERHYICVTAQKPQT